MGARGKTGSGGNYVIDCLPEICHLRRIATRFPPENLEWMYVSEFLFLVFICINIYTASLFSGQ